MENNTLSLDTHLTPTVKYDYLVTLSDDVVGALIDNVDDYTSKKKNLISINSALEEFKSL